MQLTWWGSLQLYPAQCNNMEHNWMKYERSFFFIHMSKHAFIPRARLSISVVRLVALSWRVSWAWLSASIGDCWAHASCELRLNVCFLGLASSHPRHRRRHRDERWPGGWRGSWGRTVGLSGWPASEGQDGQGRGDVTWWSSLLMICQDWNWIMIMICLDWNCVTRRFSLPLFCQDWNWIRFAQYLDLFRHSATVCIPFMIFQNKCW